MDNKLVDCAIDFNSLNIGDRYKNIMFSFSDITFTKISDDSLIYAKKNKDGSELSSVETVKYSSVGKYYYFSNSSYFSPLTDKYWSKCE